MRAARISLAIAVAALAAAAAPPRGDAQEEPAAPRSVRRIPLSDAPPSAEAPKPTADAPPAPPGPHPLLPALRIAYRSYEFLNTQVRDYSFRLVKRERIDGQLRPHEYIDAKVRHDWRVGGRQVHPRSLYMKFVAPESLAGREILWVEGQNNNQMIVRRGGRRFHYVTVEMSPDNEAVFRESRYTIKDMGLKMMVRRLIEVGRSDMEYGECEVRFFHDVEVDDRTTTCIQIVHPRRRPQFSFHVARIFVDDEYPVPIRYELYDWPAEEGGAPVLLEEYTFQNLKLNVGFSDAEFRRDYAGYRFRD